ncbi:porin [Marinospirillum perlucidum]|uniref:porin n=1 Tax=Marinospirillum perlucidum TaxID=1982602 RepID=UPI001390667B|nr:porin [Marinospirillum perlucidum]
MKKTLIAASIAALSVGTAQAAVTLNETETGSFSTYGKVVLQLHNADGVNQIQDNGSRFGFSGESQINEDINAFANAEFRFNAGYTNTTAPTVRYSYVGVEGGFGKVTAGNFDSVYYTTVAGTADIMEMNGYRSFDGEITTSAGSVEFGKGGGFSLAYETVDMSGFKAFVGLRHYAEDTNATTGTKSYPSAVDNGDELWNVQLGATYALSDALSLGVAFDQNNEDIYGFAVDPIMAASVNYSADAVGAFAVVETVEDAMIVNLGGSFNYGAGDVYGLVSYADDSSETGLDLAAGANYGLSDNFYLFGEYAQGNDTVSNIGDYSTVTVGANYNW